MREIAAAEARKRFGSLLDLVVQGEEIVITRRGKPVARLVREPAVPNRDKARRAAANILNGRKGRSLGGMTIRELIDEGRR